jgi:hypothetical protein
MLFYYIKRILKNVTYICKELPTNGPQNGPDFLTLQSQAEQGHLYLPVRLPVWKEEELSAPMSKALDHICPVFFS